MVIAGLLVPSKGAEVQSLILNGHLKMSALPQKLVKAARQRAAVMDGA
jgi:hypothetical protein